MIDASHIKTHLHTVGGNQDVNRTKGAQHKTTPRGCVWYAGQSCYYAEYRSRLYPGFSPD
ncbi:hypothetical protein SAMN05428977_102328 [Nitrosomonas sp. Nm166]|nr:hypothetical protein SAMN05428977_102328 [Nitrosomonas sp. Nm166]